MTRSSTYSVVDTHIRKIESGNADAIEYVFLEDELEFCYDWQESILTEFLNRLLRKAIQEDAHRADLFSLIETALIHRRGPTPRGLAISELIHACRLPAAEDSLVANTLKLCACLQPEGEVLNFVEEGMNAEKEGLRKAAAKTKEFWAAR